MNWKIGKTVSAAVLAAFLLASCGEKPAAGNPAPSAPAASAPAVSASAPVSGGQGYVFTSGGTDIVIDAEAAPIIEALGEPDSYYEAASCAFDGLDKMYTYASFEVDTYPMEDVDYISSVTLRDDLVSTAEGISIGDSEADVKAAYGEGTAENNELVYEKDGMTLHFILQDGAVSSIQYRSSALDG